MKDHVRFDSLENQGQVVKLHAGLTHLHMLYEDLEDNRYYHFVLDKNMVIESVLGLTDVKKMFAPDAIQWLEPAALPDNAVKFSFRLNDSNYSFDRHGDVYLDQDKVGKAGQSCFSGSLPHITAELSLVCRDRMFVCGVDNEYREQVFVELAHPFSVETDVLRQYHLNHGSGDLYVTTMAGDKTDRKIWIGGHLTSYSGETAGKTRPYLETFSF